MVTMPTSSSDPVRAAMRARAEWHEAQAVRLVPQAPTLDEITTAHRELAIPWRRLELRLYGLALECDSTVSGVD
jgi:hypothetical protein